MKDSEIKRDWLRILSPAVLGIIIAIIGIIISYAEMNQSGGWSYLGVLMLAPVFAILFTLDVIVKLLFKNKTFVIWIVELLALGLIYVFWVARFVR